MSNGATSRNYHRDTSENWEIDLERLELLHDEILGEGEFGVVYKGRYRGEDGQIFDVAVKELKGRNTVVQNFTFRSVVKCGIKMPTTFCCCCCFVFLLLFFFVVVVLFCFFT